MLQNAGLINSLALLYRALVIYHLHLLDGCLNFSDDDGNRFLRKDFDLKKNRHHFTRKKASVINIFAFALSELLVIQLTVIYSFNRIGLEDIIGVLASEQSQPTVLLK